MRFLTVVLLVALAAAAGWGWYFGPYFVDAWKMEDIAGTAAITWSALGEDKGHAKLSEEMRRREIPAYLTEDKCTFYEDAGQMKVVDCDWYVDVYPPLITPRRLKFRVTKASDANGKLEDR